MNVSTRRCRKAASSTSPSLNERSHAPTTSSVSRGFFQLLLFSFQLGETPGQTLRSGSFLYGVQYVPLLLSVRVQLLPIRGSRIGGIVLLLDLQDPRRELPDHVIGQHVLDGRLDHAILEVVALDRLQLALRPALLRPALVIVVHLPKVAWSMIGSAGISTPWISKRPKYFSFLSIR